MSPQEAEKTTKSVNLSNLSQQQQRELLQKLLQQRVREETEFPLSAGQQGLWYAYRRDPAFTPFNVFLPTRIRSELNVPALRRAIEFLVDRHPCLRTTFSDKNSTPRQEVHVSLPPEFVVEDAQGWELVDVQERIQLETQRPFDLERGPLLRIHVYKLHSNDFVVLATTHHIVVDFWSLILLLRELQIVYPSLSAGQTPQLRPASGNYSVFVREQERILNGPLRQTLSDQWRKTLEGVPTVLELPTDFARPANFSGQASVMPLEFPQSIAARVTQFASGQQATPFAVIHSVLQVLLSRYSGQKSFLIGSPFSGRGHQKFEDTVGFFVNMLPLRANLEDDPSFSTLVGRFGQTLADAIEYQMYPFAQIVRDSAPVRDPSRSPMFQVSCTFEKAQDREEAGRAGFLFPNKLEVRSFGGLVQESFYVPHRTCHYDIEFIFELTDALRGMIVYARELFDERSMSAFASNYQSLLANLLDQPRVPVSQVAWHFGCESTARVAGGESLRPVSQFAGDTTRQSQPTVCELFSAVAMRRANQVAVVDGSLTLTFGELFSSAQAIAKHLRELGVARETFVPVCGQRGAKMLTGILGALFSGGAFIPIDTKQPALTNSQLSHDTAPRVALVDLDSKEYAKGLGCSVIEIPLDSNSLSGHAREEHAATASAIAPTDLAYVIYTSGTTGTPKGVMVEHRAIANTLAWRAETVPLNNHDRVLLLLSHQFDACIGVVFTAVTQAATVVYVDPEARHDVEKLIDQILRERITILPAVPSLVRVLVTHPRFKECQTIRQIWTGGEAMPPDLYDLLTRVSAAELWNFYGPTEAAVEATACKVVAHDARRPVPIGTPILNTMVAVLDDDLQEVPDTVPGQLAIMGPGLARGYLNDPQLTAERFVTLTVSAKPQRTYLTGDRGRRMPDGNLEFLGRTDQQIKLRGYRIELGEIESLLQTHPWVQCAAAKIMRAETPSAQLVSYVTLFDPQVPQNLSQQLRAYLADRLPAYKIPAAIRALDHLPVTASGKIDRKSLPDIQLDGRDDEQMVAPSTPLEAYLADVWKGVLQFERVGVNQNFFDLGGSSLQAAMLTAQLSSSLGVHVPTALLFDLADISQIAQRLVQLYESEMAERFGLEATTAYGARHALVRRSQEKVSDRQVHPLLSVLKSNGELPPIFLVHPPGGIVVCYRELAKHLPSNQPLIGIRSRGLHGKEELPESLEQMAAEYLAAIRTCQPHGPYVLGGWSLGGMVAFEMAQQLMRQNEGVDRLLLLDTTIAKGSTDLVPFVEQENAGMEYGIDLTLDELSQLEPAEQLPFLWQHARNLGVLENETPELVVEQVLKDLQALFHHHVALATNYRLQRYSGRIVLIRPRETPFTIHVSEDRGWRRIANQVQVHFVPGHHHSMVQSPHVGELARVLVQG